MPSLAYDYTVLEEGQGDETDYAVATQQAINGGSAWKMQGSVGRGLMEAINAGAAMLGVNSARDYYGNYIPSRSEVLAGTKGSYEFVKKANGKEYADMLAAL